MLLELETLEAIARGDIDLAFRRWKRPTVRAGGQLRTALGVLSIESLDVVTQASISAQDSRRAGYGSRSQVLDALRGREGRVYRIGLRFAGADPREALRERPLDSGTELRKLGERLTRMDERSPDGEWTSRVLAAIENSPRVRAADVAASLGMEKTKFKQRVRKLKALGLTESLQVGYRLSTRGKSLCRTTT